MKFTRCCKKCLVDKDQSEFGKNKSKKDGLDIYCKSCNAIKTKNSKKDTEKIKEYNKKYRDENKEYFQKYIREYYSLNSEDIKKRTKIYSKSEKSKECARRYRQKSKAKLSEYGSVYRELNKDELREYFRIYRREKRNSDILYKLRDQLRHRISESLKSKGLRKNSSTLDIIGCSIEEFKNFIESKFEPWMTWENHGIYNGDLDHGWDIDHIIPVSMAKTEDELLRLNHYTNLQPLCSYVNRYIKMDKYNESN